MKEHDLNKHSPSRGSQARIPIKLRKAMHVLDEVLHKLVEFGSTKVSITNRKSKDYNVHRTMSSLRHMRYTPKTATEHTRETSRAGMVPNKAREHEQVSSQIGWVIRECNVRSQP